MAPDRRDGVQLAGLLCCAHVLAQAHRKVSAVGFHNANVGRPDPCTQACVFSAGDQVDASVLTSNVLRDCHTCSGYRTMVGFCVLAMSAQCTVDSVVAFVKARRFCGP